jgi:hypothetical protein
MEMAHVTEYKRKRRSIATNEDDGVRDADTPLALFRRQCERHEQMALIRREMDFCKQTECSALIREHEAHAQVIECRVREDCCRVKLNELKCNVDARHPGECALDHSEFESNLQRSVHLFK